MVTIERSNRSVIPGHALLFSVLNPRDVLVFEACSPVSIRLSSGISGLCHQAQGSAEKHNSQRQGSGINTDQVKTPATCEESEEEPQYKTFDRSEHRNRNSRSGDAHSGHAEGGQEASWGVGVDTSTAAGNPRLNPKLRLQGLGCLNFLVSHVCIFLAGIFEASPSKAQSHFWGYISGGITCFRGME